MDEPIKNPVEEYFKEGLNSESTFQDLFEADKNNVDLRTDLSVQEIVIINKLFIDNEFLIEKLNLPLFDSFINHYLRLKVSKDRLSRAEFVDVNRRDRFRQNIQDFSNFSNIMEAKK